MATAFVNDRIELLALATSRITNGSVVLSSTSSTFTIASGATVTTPSSLVLTATTNAYTAPVYAWYKQIIGPGGDPSPVLIVGAVSSTYTVTGDAAFITAMGSNSIIKYTVEVSQATYNTSSAYFDLPVLQSGTEGSSPTIYWLNTSAAVIQQNISKLYNPTTLTVYGYTATGATTTAYAGRFKIYENGSGTASYTSSINESSKVYTPSNTGVYQIKVELYLAGGFTTLLDSEIVPVVVDGSSVITVNITNETNVYPAPNTGNIGITFGTATSVVTAYVGSTRLNYSAVTTGTGAFIFSCAYGTQVPSPGVTVGAGTPGVNTFTVPTPTAMTLGVDIVSLPIIVTVRDPYGVVYGTVTQNITYSLARAGVAGSSATMYWVTTSADVIQQNMLKAFNPTTLTVYGYTATGATTTAHAGMFKIYENNVNGNNILIYTTTGTNESIKVYTPSGPSVTQIKVELYRSITDATLLDSEIVPVVVDGSSAVTINVVNDTNIYSAEATGFSNIQFGTRKTVVTAYIGSTQLNYGTVANNTSFQFSCAYGAQVPTASLTIGGGVNAGSAFEMPAPIAISADMVTLEVLVTIITPSGATHAILTQTVVYSLNRVGAPAVLADLASEADVVPALNDGSGYTLPPANTLRVYKGGIAQPLFSVGIDNAVMGGAVIVSKGGLKATITNGSTSAAIVFTSDPNWTSSGESFSFTATLVNGGPVYTAIYTVAKSKVGDSAVFIDLLSESDVVSALVDGTSYGTIPSNDIRIYKGGAEQVATSYGATATPGTQISNVGGLIATVNVTNGTITWSGTWTTDSASFTFNAVYLGTTYTTVYTVSKSKSGTNGAIAVFAYQVLNSASLPSSPTIVQNAVPTTGVVITNGIWYTRPKATLGANDWQFQIGGTLSASGVYTWDAGLTGYISTFKVGKLSALAIETGDLTMTTTGSGIKSGKTSGTDTLHDGFYLGNESGTPKLFIGNVGDTRSLKWDGSTLTLKGGSLQIGTNPAISGITMTGSGAIIQNDGTFALGNAAGNITYDGSTTRLNGPLVVNTNIKAGIGLGNLLTNSGPIPGSMSNWSIRTSNASPAVNSLQNGGSGLSPAGLDTIGLVTLGATTDNQYTYVSVGNLSSAALAVATCVPVVPGQMYEWSFYGATTAKNMRPTIVWLSASGSLVFETESIPGTISGVPVGNNYSDLSKWSRATMMATAPADAVIAVPSCIVIHNTVASGMIVSLITCAYFGKTTPNQTEYSPWSDGSGGKLALDTGNLKDNAITNIQSMINTAPKYLYNAANYTDISNMTVVSTGAPALITISGRITCDTAPPPGLINSYLMIQLVDGGNYFMGSWLFGAPESYIQGENQEITITRQVTLSAGSHVITLQARIAETGTPGNGTLTAITVPYGMVTTYVELKK